VYGDQKKNYGIILRVFSPERTYLNIFDRELGRINVRVAGRARKDQLSAGVMIEYAVQLAHHARKDHTIDAIELYAVSKYTNLPDLAFFHQVLEICLHSIPLGAVADDLFDLVGLLYCPVRSGVLSDSLTKKIFFLRTFFILGIHVDQHVDQYKLTANDLKFVLTHPIENIKNTVENQALEEILDRWIQHSLVSHPRMHLFKTVHTGSIV
jgi:hypothetical protein